MRPIDADAFDERVRAAGGMSEEELSEDFKDGVQTVLYMMSKQPTITAQPEETHDKRTETHKCDCISRADVEQTVEDNILCYTHSDRPIDQDPDTECHKAIRTALRMLRKDLRKLPSAQPDNRLSKIAELVEGTIDHFDLDDAMDLLYQIKEIVGNETSNI